MSEHSRLSPSAMTRILRCPASAVDNPPDTGSAAASEGTLAHSLGEQVLRGDENVEFPNDEMRKAVFEYVAYVRAHKSHDELDGVDHANSAVTYEERIVSTLIPDHGGTIDTLIVSDTHIHVMDFKYGVMPVSSFDNKQLLSYLALADEAYPGKERFFASIIQPRVYGTPDCVEYSRDQLDQHVLDIMLTAGDTDRAAGDHCRWCPLKPTCSDLENHLVQVASEEFSDGWSSRKCKEVITMGGVFSTMVSDAKAHLTRLMKSGEKVDGWKLVTQLGIRCWRDPSELVALEAAGQIKEDVLYEKKMRSPAQLEKQSKVFKTLTASHAHRPERGVIAVESSSNLPEYDPTAAFDDAI